MLGIIYVVLLSSTFYLISCRSSKPVIRPGPKPPLLAPHGLWLFHLSGRDNVCSTAVCIAAVVALVVQGNGEHRVLEQDLDNALHNAA
jgi:hypothetical protein